jgi:DNA uptake protein ComE-like DNA-binding protein
MRTLTQALMCSLLLLPFTACTTEQRNPDQIRRETAQATSTAAKDAKAVAQGVVEGLKQKGPVNINKASDDDLKSLPGIDEAAARRIIDNRPYDASDDMVKKHVITKAEYDHIADKVTAK